MSAHLPLPTDTLLRKAARDAGFDLVLGTHGEWARIARSGAVGSVWIRQGGAGALLASTSARLTAEARSASPAPEAADGGDLPPGVADAVSYASAADLYRALCRVRVLMAETPARLSERVRARLAAITDTEVTAEVTQRVGQDVFRDALDEYWEGRCAVSGTALRAVLRGSHTKPWKDATDAERLDVHNGFLLAAHLDALYDAGLMTFTDDGEVLFSSRVSAADRVALGLGADGLRLRWVAEGHLSFLDYHRRVVFKA